MTESETNPDFREWVMLELMGHRRLFGLLTEQEIAGGKFLRIEIPNCKTGPSMTQFYSPSAVYAITPMAENFCRKMAAGNHPAPISRYELPAPEDDGEPVSETSEFDRA